MLGRTKVLVPVKVLEHGRAMVDPFPHHGADHAEVVGTAADLGK